MLPNYMNCKGFIVLALSLALCHADDPMEEIMAERTNKASLATNIQKKITVAPAPKNKVTFSQREMEKTSMLVQTAADEAKDAVSKALGKLTEAEDLEKKAQKIDVSFQGAMTKETEKNIKKIDWEVSFLQQEELSALRKRDQSFAQKEISKLLSDKQKAEKSVHQKVQMFSHQKQEMEKKAKRIRAKASVELDEASNIFSSVEAVSQSVEEWGNKVPSWMVQSQIEQARKSVAKQQKEASELKEFNSKKRALWEVQGKEFTCSESAPAIRTFMLDTKKDNSANVECLEKQLNKYCLNHIRAPAMNGKQALTLVGTADDCLPKGIDKRVPTEKRGAVGAKWCTFVSILQAMSMGAQKNPYFLILEDDINVDHKEFEETVSSFAQTYRDEPWDILQIDPFGTHSERDEDMVPHFKGLPVFRNSRHGQYFGFHTVLVKTASAPKILERMMSMPAVPLDTLPTLLNEEACDVGGCKLSSPSALALQAFVSETPRADQTASALVQRSRVPKVCQTEVPQGLSELQANSWSSLMQVFRRSGGSVISVDKPQKKKRRLARGFATVNEH